MISHNHSTNLLLVMYFIYRLLTSFNLLFTPILCLRVSGKCVRVVGVCGNTVPESGASQEGILESEDEHRGLPPSGRGEPHRGLSPLATGSEVSFTRVEGIIANF